MLRHRPTIDAVKTAMEMFAADHGDYNGTAAIIETAAAIQTMLDAAGVDLWPTNLVVGTANGNLCDGMVPADGSSGYQLMSVGRDASHTFIYDNGANTITAHGDTTI